MRSFIVISRVYGEGLTFWFCLLMYAIDGS